MNAKCEWLTDKYIAAMLLVFPLWTGFHGYSDITRSKFVFFAAATAIWLAALTVLRIAGRERRRRPTAGRLCASAFMLAAAASWLLSDYRSASLLGSARYDGLVTLLLYGGIFLGVSAYGKPKKYYVYLLAVSASLCSAVALCQLGGVDALGLFPDGLSYSDSGTLYAGQYLGTIGNVDILAAFYCLCIPVFIGTAASSGEKRDLALLAPAALCAWVLWRSGVSSGILALCVCALVAVPYYVNLCFHRRGLTRLFVCLSAALCAAALAAVYFWPGDSGTVWELSRLMRGDAADSFGSHRVLIWRDALSLWRERPIFGSGPDAYATVSGLRFTRYVPETGVTLIAYVDNAHNEFLNYLVNIGLLGLLPYIALCVLTVSYWLCGSAPGFGCGALCYVVQSVFGLGLCLVVPVFWIFMGLVCPDGGETDWMKG